MSRSGYSDDCDNEYGVNPWPAIIKRAVQGKPGVAFLRELLAALDAMPVKELIQNELVEADGAVCALGSVGRTRGLDMSHIDPEDYAAVGKAFGITETLAREIEFQNDDDFSYSSRETPAQRWTRMRAWVARQIEEAEGRHQNAEKWTAELAAAGWVKSGRNRWRSPSGDEFRGPYWAWHQMDCARRGVRP